MSEMMTAAIEILDRQRRERETLLAAQAAKVAEHRAAEKAYHASLPQLHYAPDVPQPGKQYRLATDRIWAFDGQRAWLAATPGQWLESSRAEVLGIGGPPVTLVAG